MVDDEKRFQNRVRKLMKYQLNPDFKPEVIRNLKRVLILERLAVRYRPLMQKN